VDFCCVQHKLIVELDGDQHDEEGQIAYDRVRTAYLRTCGYRVLRFWNSEVFEDLETVLDIIADEIVGSPHPDPLPGGEGTLDEKDRVRKRR
jgi:very-short-patch-repair endonuclease